MTIKELETRLGIDRATVRYYEKEGLLIPERKLNGYRDYSEDDAATLEKIALLRQLGLSIEMIRAIQQGQMPLGLALERQDEALLVRQMETRQALHISRAIRAEGASYQTLQPNKYKAQLPPPAWQSRVIPPAEQKKHDAAEHPWRRYLARRLDMVLYGLPWELAAVLFFRISWDSTLYKVLAWAGVMGTFLLLEPLLLSTWGTTPGKRLMGLQLQYCYSTRTGKPYYGEAFLRSLTLCWSGIGFGIPMVEPLCMFLCYRRAKRGKEQSWDEIWEYTAEPAVSFRRKLTYVAAVAAVILCLIPVVFYVQRPINRGEDLTLEEYVENVNDIMAFQQNSPCYQLKNDGTWVHDRNHSTFCNWEFSSYYYFAPLEMKTEGGQIVGVTVDMTRCTAQLRKGQMQIVSRALVFADRNISYREMADLLEDAYTLSYKDGLQVGMTAQGWHFYWENQRFTVEKAS